MVTIPSLWLSILLGAVLVFVVSSVIHMFLAYHRNDYSQVPDEDGVMDALRPFNVPPGDYVVPFPGSPENMRSEAFRAKIEKGPVAFMTVIDGRDWQNMGSQLVQWFVYCLIVGVFVAYITGRTMPQDAEYLAVFRVSGATAFCCYALALMQRSIWYRQNWSATLKSMFDGLIYALVTAGAFAGFWPGG